jgi:hypothetical protein
MEISDGEESLFSADKCADLMAGENKERINKKARVGRKDLEEHEDPDYCYTEGVSDLMDSSESFNNGLSCMCDDVNGFAEKSSIFSEILTAIEYVERDDSEYADLMDALGRTRDVSPGAPADEPARAIESVTSLTEMSDSKFRATQSDDVTYLTGNRDRNFEIDNEVKKTSNKENEEPNFGRETALSTGKVKFTPDPRAELWIGDSGASSHMTNSDIGVYSRKTCDLKINIADGTTIDVVYIGQLDVLFIQKDGTRAKKTLTVKVAPALKHSLFSFTAAMLMVGLCLESRKEENYR